MPTPLKDALAAKGRKDGKPREYKDLPVVGKFKVLRGKHLEGGIIYSPGDVVESKKDLSTLGTDKFQPIASKKSRNVNPPEDEEEDEDEDKEQEVNSSEDDESLGDLTIPQLRNKASSEGVELRSGMSKAEIIQAIKDKRDEEDE